MSTGKERKSFAERQAENRSVVDSLDRDNTYERKEFFRDVYRHACGDAAMIPWADLAPKQMIREWLANNPGNGGQSAIDVACGLGDNAEALAATGYRTAAFDYSADAIRWARERFPRSAVDYSTADMFALPGAWLGAFDLVNECYTLQSLPPEMLEKSALAISRLVKPGGTLLVYARYRPDKTPVDGPPWPLEKTRLEVFRTFGLEKVKEQFFDVQKPGRKIPHAFYQWRKR